MEAPSPEPAAIVGSQAAHGAMWTLLFTGVTKLTTLGSQIALAWFLVPEEFGLVAMTLSVMSFTAIVGGGNLRNVLVQSPASFAENAGQAFWLALALNLGSALFLAVASPWAGILFKEPRIMSLILVASMSPFLQSLSTIYIASLQRDLKFRQIAMIQCSAGGVQNGLAVLLAWLGAGAFSLVLPLTVTATWTAIAYRLCAGKIPVGTPDPRRWCVLASPVSWLMLHSLFTAMLASGATMAIGLVQHDPAIIGFYFWGFSVSSQAVFLLVTNLQGVLFPALSKLNSNPERQFIAVEKAARTLLVVVTPVCLLQWLLAQPLVSSMFHSRWTPAVSVVEWISIGLLSQPLYLLTVSLLLARGWFRRLALITGCIAFATITAALVGSIVGDQSVIARYVGLTLLVSNVGAGWATFREFKRGWKELLSLIAPVVLIGLPTTAIGWWIVSATSGGRTVNQVIATTIVVLVSYGLLVKIYLPQVATDAAIRLSANCKKGGSLNSHGVNCQRLPS